MLFGNSYNMLKIHYTFYILKKGDNNYNNQSLPFSLTFKDKQFLLLYSAYNDELIRYPLQYIQNVYLMERIHLGETPTSLINGYKSYTCNDNKIKGK